MWAEGRRAFMDLIMFLPRCVCSERVYITRIHSSFVAPYYEEGEAKL